MFCKHNKSLVLASLTILASITIYNIYGASNAFAATASMSTTGAVSIDVSASGNSANIGTDTLTVDTTCSTGYTVTIQSSIDDTTLYKDGDSTSNSKITPTAGTLSSPLPIIGDDGNGTSYLGTWGYSMTSSAVTGTFTGLNSTPTIIKQSSAASATGGDKFPVYYGVSVTPSLEVGSYKMSNNGTIVYQLTMPIECEPYRISYNGNGADTGITMSVTNTVDNGAETTLMPSNYKRANYGFAGWNTKADGTGVDFGPMETVTLSPSDTKGNALIQAANQNKEITLYAKWIAPAGNLQGWQGCNSMTNGQVTALKDTRDNNVYAIAKLADGNCWMIENLRLGSNSPITLTPADSNVTADFTLSATTNPTTTAWCTTTDANCYNQSMLSSNNTTNPVANMDSATLDGNVSTGIYSYGNYYNWYSATAGTGTYSTSTNNTSVASSVCPVGWHLPIGGRKANVNNSEFWQLPRAIIGSDPANFANDYFYYTGDPEGTNASKLLRTYPNNFLYSGYVYGSSLYNRGSGANVWSSTADSSYYAYYLYFNSSYVIPGTNINTKYNGFSVRCVAGEDVNIEKAYARAGKTKQTVGGQSYYKMQDMNDSICDAVNVLDEPGQTQLVDIRDNKIYWATKLQDGKCWMTQNLGLDLSNTTALTSDTTDLTSYGSGGYTTANGYSQQTVNGKNVISWTPTRATIDASNVTNNSISGWSNDYNTPYSVDPGNWYWNALPFYTSTENNFLAGSGGTKWQKNTAYANNGEHGHIGNYYNWSAAVASNSTSSYTASTLSNPTNNPQNSICPAGWRLPTVTSASPTYTTAGSQDEFSRLANLYANYTGSTSLSSENLEKAPLYLVRGGYVGSSQQDNAGYNGYYWSSSVRSSSYAHNLDLRSGYVSPQGNGYRYYGFSVRCVSR